MTQMKHTRLASRAIARAVNAFAHILVLAEAEHIYTHRHRHSEVLYPKELEPLIILMLRFSKSRDRQNWACPIRQYISTKSFNAEHCFQLVVHVLIIFAWIYFN